MEVSYKPTVDDVIAVADQLAAGSRSLRRNYWLMYLGVPTLMIVGWGTLLAFSDDASYPAGWIPLLVPIFWLAWYPWKYRRMIRKSAERMLKEGQNKLLLAERHLVLDAEGIHGRSEFGGSSIKWAAFERVTVTPEYVFLILGSESAIAVPRRALDSDDAFAEFGSFVHQHASNPP